jgi:Zn-dependent protease with chaperone function
MNFFELQQAAHTRTRWLNFAFLLLAIPSAVGFAVMVVLLFGFLFGLGPFEFLESLMDGTPAAGRALLPAGAASVVLVGMLLLWKQAQFDDASNYMAAELDCTYLSRETEDAELRRVLNVTEEMAVAGGIAPPHVFIWPTGAINAFAIGRNTSDASIFISRGAIAALSRDEMQALVAHGVGQILNGDMAMNVRLANHLFIYKVAPRVAIFILGLPMFLVKPLPKKLQGIVGGILGLPWIFTGMIPALLLVFVSAPSALLARPMQLLAGRQRKFLADACAVQFTRNAPALRTVLARARNQAGSESSLPTFLADYAHACFVAPSRGRLLSTHPSVDARIRTLCKAFGLSVVSEPVRARVGSALPLRQDWRKFLAPTAGPRQQEMARKTRETFLQRLASAAAVAAILPARPAEPLAGITSSRDARSGLLALLIDRQPAVQLRQLASLEKLFGPQSRAALLEALHALRPMQHAERTLALEAHLPALRGLPPPELGRVLAAIVQIQAMDDHIDVIEYAVSRFAAVFMADLLRPRASHGSQKLSGHSHDVHLLFSVMAQQGDRGDAAAAYEVGIRSLGPNSWPPYGRKEGWVLALDNALEKLDRLGPIEKQMLIEGLAKTITFDRAQAPAERELLRMTAACLHCPLPRTEAGLGTTNR